MVVEPDFTDKSHIINFFNIKDSNIELINKSTVAIHTDANWYTADYKIFIGDNISNDIEFYKTEGNFVLFADSYSNKITIVTLNKNQHTDI